MKVTIVLFCLFATLMTQELQDKGEARTEFPPEDIDDSDLTADSTKHHKMHHYKGYNQYTPTNYGLHSASYYSMPMQHVMPVYGPSVYSQRVYQPSYHNVHQRVYQPSYHNVHPIHAMKMYKKAMHKGIHG
ncbi:hypothetical protein QYM36_009118 [Artemia franciscana]|uniref:Uncharacterized protein n=1 Tax=Artemia franciscana TaxID=6661 RepID=A0AA88L6K9_ARTSF|nr:hypothetical protein QYM36_009118 [Artemia franciscana]